LVAPDVSTSLSMPTTLLTPEKVAAAPAAGSVAVPCICPVPPVEMLLTVVAL